MSIFNKAQAAFALGVMLTAASFFPHSSALADSKTSSSSSSRDHSGGSSSDDSHGSSGSAGKCKPHISSSQIKDYGYYKSTIAHGTCLDLIGAGVTGVTPKVQVAQPDGTFELLPLGNGAKNPVTDDFYTINSATELEIVTHRPTLSATDVAGLFEVKLERCDLVQGKVACGSNDGSDSSSDDHGHSSISSSSGSEHEHDDDSGDGHGYSTQLILVPLVDGGA